MRTRLALGVGLANAPLFAVGLVLRPVLKLAFSIAVANASALGTKLHLPVGHHYAAVVARVQMRAMVGVILLLALLLNASLVDSIELRGIEFSCPERSEYVAAATSH